MMIESIKTLGAGLKKPDFVFAKVQGMTYDRDEAAAILTVLPRLMNQMIVQILLDGDLEGTQSHSISLFVNIELHVYPSRVSYFSPNLLPCSQ